MSIYLENVLFLNESSNSDSKIISLIKKLPDLDKPKPASIQDIENAEKELGVKFSNEYKECLKEFGYVGAGATELTGIYDVVKVTKREWKLNSNVPHNMYAIEAAGDGIMIWQDASGSIYETLTRSKKPNKIASSLYDYIKNNIMKR